jgi:type VI secretion system protein
MPIGPSLYELLAGHVGGVALDERDEAAQEILSVMENLTQILNARAGALKHLPDYGLPDLSHIYRALPASAHLLKTQIEKTLLAYEPRIRAIDLELLHDTDPGMLVSYDLTCHLKKGGLVRYGTHFDPSGRTLMRCVAAD